MDKLERHLGVEIKRTWEECVKNSAVYISGVYEKDQENENRVETLNLKVPKGCQCGNVLLKMRIWIPGERSG